MTGPLILFTAAFAVLIAAVTAVLIYVLHHPQRKTYAYALANNLPTDPAQLGLTFTEQQFRLTDGSSTVGWVIQGANPSGPVMIISHGWSSGRYGSLTRVPKLMPLASRIVVYDLPGHGESQGSLCWMGITEAKDLLGIIDQLDITDRSVVLYGSSMGAGVSIVAGAHKTAPDRGIAAVIVEGPYRRFHEPIIGQLRSYRLPPYPIIWLATFYMAIRTKGLAGFDRALHAARLKCPLLVMHGVKDPICRLESAKQIADAARQSRLIVFEDGRHEDLAMVDPKRYFQAIADFLGTIFDSVQSPDLDISGPKPSPTTKVPSGGD